MNRRTRFRDKVLHVSRFLLRFARFNVGADNGRVRVPGERLEYFTQPRGVPAEGRPVDARLYRMDIYKQNAAQQSVVRFIV